MISSSIVLTIVIDWMNGLNYGMKDHYFCKHLVSKRGSSSSGGISSYKRDMNYGFCYGVPGRFSWAVSLNHRSSNKVFRRQCRQETTDNTIGVKQASNQLLDYLNLRKRKTHLTRDGGDVVTTTTTCPWAAAAAAVMLLSRCPPPFRSGWAVSTTVTASSVPPTHWGREEGSGTTTLLLLTDMSSAAAASSQHPE